MTDPVKKLWAHRDRVTRAITKDGTFRAAVIQNTTTVQTAQRSHGLDPMASMVLARTLTGAALMASFLKGEERIVLSLEGDGLVRSVTAEAMQVGEVRGYINLNRSPNEDRTTPLGQGLLRVQRILYGEYEPVMGIVELRRGDVTSDLGYYLTQSEQIPSAFVIDVAFDGEKIRQSVGLVVQAMPGARAEDIFKLYDSIDYLNRLTEYADAGYGPNEILQQIMPSEIDIVASSPVDFFCRCSHERFTSALMTLNVDEIIQMKEENQRELVCQYCSRRYELTNEDFDRLINRTEGP